MKKLAQILEELIEKDPALKRLKSPRIGELLREALGDILSSKVFFESYENGILMVRCSDPMWRSELELMKDRIVARMNELAGEKLIRKMVIRRG